jgi:hypothetical protein
MWDAQKKGRANDARPERGSEMFTHTIRAARAAKDTSPLKKNSPGDQEIKKICFWLY